MNFLGIDSCDKEQLVRAKKSVMGGRAGGYSCRDYVESASLLVLSLTLLSLKLLFSPPLLHPPLAFQRERR